MSDEWIRAYVQEAIERLSEKIEAGDSILQSHLAALADKVETARKTLDERQTRENNIRVEMKDYVPLVGYNERMIRTDREYSTLEERLRSLEQGKSQAQGGVTTAQYLLGVLLLVAGLVIAAVATRVPK